MSRYTTPEKSGNHRSSGTFTPIVLPQSPAADTPQRNITGLPRVARDLAADIYNDIQHWNSLHIAGASLVKQIAKIKCDTLRNYVYPIDLEDLCNDLMKIIDDLQETNTSLKRSKTRMAALIPLHKSNKPLFISWPVTKLSEAADIVSKSYDMEIKVKRTICETISHSASKEEAMFQAAAWAAQPYIDNHVRLTLEALLTETGHRNRRR